MRMSARGPTGAEDSNHKCDPSQAEHHGRRLWSWFNTQERSKPLRVGDSLDDCLPRKVILLE